MQRVTFVGDILTIDHRLECVLLADQRAVHPSIDAGSAQDKSHHSAYPALSPTPDHPDTRLNFSAGLQAVVEL